MAKEDGAFLTIGELARELGVAQHILRYWESRFPQLKPLQRSGNRRYYRPGDVDLARRINRLLNEEGFTVRGAQRALASRKSSSAESAPPADAAQPAPLPGSDEAVSHEAGQAESGAKSSTTGRGRSSHQAGFPMDDLFSAPAPEQPRHDQRLTSPDISLLIARLTVIRENLEEALKPG